MTVTPTPAMTAADVLARLRAQSSPDDVAGMARFGIRPDRNLGVSMQPIRALAREARGAYGRDRSAWHAVALELWRLGYRDTRLTAIFTDHPSQVTGDQMEAWAADLDSWDVCDGVCIHLFSRSPLAWEKAGAWAGRDEEFVKRAGFVLIASLATHDRSAEDDAFIAMLPLIEREASDDRNFVKKAVNWALRHIGKRNAALNGEAIGCAERILLEQSDSPAARWIARDALRELRSDAIRTRVGLA